MTSRYLSLNGNTTNVTSGAQSANSSGAPEFIPSFSVVHVARSLMFGVVFCRSLFVLLPLAIVLSVRRLFMAFDYPMVLCVLLLFTAFDYPIVLCVNLLLTAFDYPIVLCVLLLFTAFDYPIVLYVLFFLRLLITSLHICPFYAYGF